MKTALLVALILASQVSKTFAKSEEGAGSSGGGSQCLLKLHAIRDVLIKASPQIKSFQSANITSADFSSKLSRTNFDIGKNLMLEGKVVDAINYPDNLAPTIVVDQDRCDSLLANLDDGMSFLTHEIMGLMGKETREDYSISKNVLNELKNIVVTKKNSIDWKYACSLRRWHYSGMSGFEYLGTSDSYTGMAGIGYIRERSDKALNEYAIDFSVSRGPYYEHEPRLNYTFYRDPGHNPSKRQFLVPAWTQIEFDKIDADSRNVGGRVSIKLLGPEAFPKEGKETSSFLELVCYRSL